MLDRNKARLRGHHWILCPIPRVWLAIVQLNHADDLTYLFKSTINNLLTIGVWDSGKQLSQSGVGLRINLFLGFGDWFRNTLGSSVMADGAVTQGYPGLLDNGFSEVVSDAACMQRKLTSIVLRCLGSFGKRLAREELV